MKGKFKRSIWIGFDPRETAAFMVAVNSTKRNLSTNIPLAGIDLEWLMRKGWYRRPTTVVDGRLFDVISDHPMSTEFAISRFFTPKLAQEGWALFFDCDMLVLCDLNEVFRLVDPKYAVMCVKHDHQPLAATKMDNQFQSSYPRKNWSSFCLFNCAHPANAPLFDIDFINTTKGKDLHAFCWLEEDQIGELPVCYNHLIGHSEFDISNPPKVLHFTSGTPNLPGYEQTLCADKWWYELRRAVLLEEL